MKISRTWLSQWVAELPTLSNEFLSNQLTMAGLEVDAISSAAPLFSGIVVGEVTAIAAHPDADKLRIATVNVGATDSLQIVCGAPNVAVGIRVPTALIGAILPDEMTIKKGKLRGVESWGMLCSARELGLSEDHNGLMLLPADAPLGQDIRSYLDLDDTLFDIDLTPNRGDCLSMLGMAREIAALNGFTLTDYSAHNQPPVATLNAQRHIVVHTHDCPRYLGRVIEGLNPQASSPYWLVERLRRAGLRSHGALVDVTNYILLELGQPLHAFDHHQLQGDIEVRYAKAGEQLTLLNNDTVSLRENTLLICDQQGPVAMAGIMGGARTACGDNTCAIFLESAWFAPISIAGRAREYGLATDAAHRYERGVDYEITRQAMERATTLLIDIAGGQAAEIVEYIDKPHLPQRQCVHLRFARLNRLLGLPLPTHDVVRYIEQLGMQVELHSDHLIAYPPSWRFDIAIEEDLIEEVARIYGYARIPTRRPAAALTMQHKTESVLTVNQLKSILIARDYQETINMSFVAPAMQALIDPDLPAIALQNPITADLAVMRTSLWVGLLRSINHNLKRQQTRIRFFESGLSFLGGSLDACEQVPMLAGAICGTRASEAWCNSPQKIDFFDIKGDLQALFAATGHTEQFQFVQDSHPALHPGQAARIYRNEQAIGWVGLIHPKLRPALDIDSDVYVFEVRLPAILTAKTPAFEEVSRFPASRRDLALLVLHSISAEQVISEIRSLNISNLKSIQLFDVYSGVGVPETHKSLAYSLIFQELSGNLSDQMIDVVIEKILQHLQAKLNISLRS